MKTVPQTAGAAGANTIVAAPGVGYFLRVHKITWSVGVAAATVAFGSATIQTPPFHCAVGTPFEIGSLPGIYDYSPGLFDLADNEAYGSASVGATSLVDSFTWYEVLRSTGLGS